MLLVAMLLVAMLLLAMLLLVMLLPTLLRAAAGDASAGAAAAGNASAGVYALTTFKKGMSSTLDMNGTLRENCSTVGRNSQNRSQKPYASTHKPIIVQPTMTKAAPAR